ncbi:MAG: hypothetical protein E7483_02890 [Ruminococcaceae bacterium]|nr:hypothetical protein [Oscillospiraceae bacterium]
MATYMYLNNGKKVPYYANSAPQTLSGPYRAFVTESSAPQTKSGTQKTSGGVAVTVSGGSQSEYDAAAAKAAEEARIRQEKINAINDGKEKEKKLLKNNYKAMKDAAKLVNSENLRQMYIAYMQGLRGIPQQAAIWGAGGEIESLKNRGRLNYETNRARENSSYAGIIGDIEQKYNSDLAELESKYLRLLLNV